MLCFSLQAGLVYAYCQRAARSFAWEAEPWLALLPQWTTQRYIRMSAKVFTDTQTAANGKFTTLIGLHERSWATCDRPLKSSVA